MAEIKDKLVTLEDLKEAYDNTVHVDDTYVKGVKGNTENDYRDGYVNISPTDIGALMNNPPAIELYPGVGSSHGGFIDFHFAGEKTSDYTSRIIESAKGHLHIHGQLTIGTPLAVTSGGTGAETLYDVAENLAFSLAFNGNNWTLANMYSKMSKVPVPGNVMLWLDPSASSALSGGKISAYCTVVASRTNTTNWRFMAFVDSGYMYTWRLENWTSSSATPTIGTVYRFSGTAI